MLSERRADGPLPLERSPARAARPDPVRRGALTEGLPAALDPVLAAFEATGWAVEVTDHAWRLCWTSPELLVVMGAAGEDDLGLGRHLLATRTLPVYASVSSRSAAAWGRTVLPGMLHDDADAARAALATWRPEVVAGLEGLAPAPAPARWSAQLEMFAPGAPGRVNLLGEVLSGPHGETLGYAQVYGPSLRPSLLAHVARGDPELFARMARLAQPGRHQAAVLFADLEASGALARRLPTAGFFDLVRSLQTGMDAAILHAGGIVGKHAGDGVTAFFLAEDAGSVPAAARAAVAAAHEVRALAERFDVALNVGLHWGATLYMGQIVTDGRLEVTALGDEVNECARVQQSARGGALLATKALVERLDPADAAHLGVDPLAVTYLPVADLPGADDKARRDAGGLAVTPLAGAGARSPGSGP